MRKVLLISYYFPPDNAVGGLRAARFAKYLPSFGWKPYIVTIKERYIEKKDSERIKDVAGVTIFRTSKLPTVRGAYLWLKKNIFRKRLDKSDSIDPTSALFDYSQEGLVQRLKRYFISLLILMPDEERNWVLPALVKSLYNIRRHGIDIIMTSSPPHSSHLAGLIIRKLTNIKWFADFRDPWIETIDCKPASIRCRLSDKIDLWLEQRVIFNADRVITTTDAFKRSLMERYPDEDKAKFVYIANGINMEKIHLQTPREIYKAFTITYAGTIYESRTPEPVFAAVERLIRQNKIMASDIKIKLVGHCHTVNGKDTRDVASLYGLNAVVDIIPPVSYSDALMMMRRSHLLLLLAPNQPLAIPAKVYEYLGAGVKILALTEEGATSELIKSTKSGKCFDHADIDGISGYIYECMTSGTANLIKNETAVFQQFDVRTLTQRLADELSAAS